MAIVCLAAIFILVARASEAAPSSNATASPPDASSIDDALRTRGLLAPDPAPDIHPPSGTEVDEYVQSTEDTGKELVRYRQWQETLAGRTLQIQVLDYPAHQRIIAFWLVQRSGAGCDAHGSRTYNGKGEEIGSGTWRNDPGLKLTDGPDFPSDLLPGWVPPIAFIRVLDGGKHEGTLHVQAGSSGILDLEVWTAGEVDLTLAGRRFRDARCSIVGSTPRRSHWPKAELFVNFSRRRYCRSAPPGPAAGFVSRACEWLNDRAIFGISEIPRGPAG